MGITERENGEGRGRGGDYFKVFRSKGGDYSREAINQGTAIIRGTIIIIINFIEFPMKWLFRNNLQYKN